MNDDQARPPAALTADRIRRGAVPMIELTSPPLTASPPAGVEEALRRQVRETVSVGAAHDAGDGGLLSWRRAGMFGLIYLGALLAFAAAFEVLPLAD
jgi:hypothetical protein